MVDQTQGPAPSVGMLLRNGAARFGDRTAVWTGGDGLSYAALARRSAELAAGLIERGVQPGDRIGLWMPNTLDAFVGYFAAALTGATVVPMNTRMTPPELDKALELARPTLVVVQERFRSAELLEMLVTSSWFAETDASRERGGLRVVVSEPSVATSRVSGAAVTTYGDVATVGRLAGVDALLGGEDRAGPDADWIVQFTSGTTSFPKGVVLGHGQCARMGFELGRRFGLVAGDRFFVANPLYHLGATNFGLLSSLSYGAGYYTLPTFDADEACTVLREQQCTLHQGIASHYLLELESSVFKPDAFALRVITVGGGVALAQRVREGFRCESVMQRYGSSETCGAPISNVWDDPLERRMNTMGTPLPGVEVAIVDRDTGEPVPAGVEGEMRLRGWCVMRRYLDDPEATARAVGADGWLRSGDLGAMDDDGYVRFASRYVDVLKVGGENVAAVEIEQVLESHPAVAAAHVVPVPDPVLAEVPYAFVEIASGDYDAEAVLEFCRTRLARYKHPRHIRVIERAELPLTGSGKVQKFKLRELAAAEWSSAR